MLCLITPFLQLLNAMKILTYENYAQNSLSHVNVIVRILLLDDDVAFRIWKTCIYKLCIYVALKINAQNANRDGKNSVLIFNVQKYLLLSIRYRAPKMNSPLLISIINLNYVFDVFELSKCSRFLMNLTQRIFNLKGTVYIWHTVCHLKDLFSSKKLNTSKCFETFSMWFYF